MFHRKPSRRQDRSTGKDANRKDPAVLFGRHKTTLPAADQALPGRAQRPFPVPDRHAVLGTALEPPYPAGLDVAVFGLGCFWGAERLFWQVPGVWSTAVGYAGGFTPHPTYEEVCSGRTGHTEAVHVVFDPARVSYRDLLRIFFEGHDPTQGMRQGNDVGTQYRSAIFTLDDAQRRAAEATRDAFSAVLRAAGHGDITTDIAPAAPFYFAEDYHQQYLHKRPGGYCGLGGTGLQCPVGIASLDAEPAQPFPPSPAADPVAGNRAVAGAGSDRPVSGER